MLMEAFAFYWTSHFLEQIGVAFFKSVCMSCMWFIAFLYSFILECSCTLHFISIFWVTFVTKNNCVWEVKYILWIVYGILYVLGRLSCMSMRVSARVTYGHSPPLHLSSHCRILYWKTTFILKSNQLPWFN